MHAQDAAASPRASRTTRAMNVASTATSENVPHASGMRAQDARRLLDVDGSEVATGGHFIPMTSLLELVIWERLAPWCSATSQLTPSSSRGLVNGCHRERQERDRGEVRERQGKRESGREREREKGGERGEERKREKERERYKETRRSGERRARERGGRWGGQERTEERGWRGEERR